VDSGGLKYQGARREFPNLVEGLSSRGLSVKGEFRVPVGGLYVWVRAGNLHEKRLKQLGIVWLAGASCRLSFTRDR